MCAHRPSTQICGDVPDDKARAIVPMLLRPGSLTCLGDEQPVRSSSLPPAGTAQLLAILQPACPPVEDYLRFRVSCPCDWGSGVA